MELKNSNFKSNHQKWSTDFFRRLHFEFWCLLLKFTVFELHFYSFLAPFLQFFVVFLKAVKTSNISIWFNVKETTCKIMLKLQLFTGKKYSEAWSLVNHYTLYFFKITVVSLHFHSLSAVCICSVLNPKLGPNIF